MLPSPEEQIDSTTPISLDRLREAADHSMPAGYLPVEAGAGSIGRWVRRWVPLSIVDSKNSRRRWIVFAAAFCVVLIATAAFLLADQPEPELPPALPVAHEVVSGKSGAAKNTDKPSESLVISVIGKVKQPGLITVPTGSRVADALTAAGGVAAGTDLTSLNLARRLEDGEQISVGLPATAAGENPPPSLSGNSAGVTKKLDLNTATAAEFDQLPGVGEVTAQRIMQWRAQHGRFSKVEQLREVEGIGESRFSKLREQVTVR